MALEITPEPDELERRAILQALAAADAERRAAASEWADALLPAREGDEREP